MKIIIAVVTFVAIVTIINALKTTQLNQKLEAEHKQTQQLLVELREEQNKKATRELTDLLQDIQFIMEVDSNCPPDEMINQIKKLYNNESGLDASIQAIYKEVLSQIDIQNCN